jgi:hypothetical protein
MNHHRQKPALTAPSSAKRAPDPESVRLLKSWFADLPRNEVERISRTGSIAARQAAAEVLAEPKQRTPAEEGDQ